MRTVGRIGWILELTNVFTRSRGTPVAALARYCRRKVLVAMRESSTQCNPRWGRRQNVKDRRERVCALSLLSCESLRLLAGERRARPRGRPDVLDDDAGHRRVEEAAASGRRPQMDVVGIRTIRMAAGVHGVFPHRATIRTALLNLEPRETSAPREAPEVPVLLLKFTCERSASRGLPSPGMMRKLTVPGAP